MDNKELIEEIRQLKEEQKELRLRVERCEAINEIQLLMGKYYNTHVANPNEPINHFNQWCFFADREDSTYEVANYGLLVGFKNIQFFFREKEGMKAHTGWMFEHDLATPQIVIADDGQTARGVWTSPGHETFWDEEKQNHRAEWAWGRVAADFLKIDGEWKIWHYHWYRLFRCPFDTPWTEFDQMGVSRPLDKERILKYGGEPDKVFPPTYFHPYSTETFVECAPKTPEPYATWTDDRLPV